ncbi:MAG: hypothetical protein KF861_05050 [Planctomycetaceae bacterium]|nr:hypothetical protein [Planctomycetaceae bacterium]
MSRRIIAGFAILFVAAVALAGDDAGVTHWSFDVDPQWDGFRNRLLPESLPTVRQDFGYRHSNFAGGRSAGEIGGTVQRTTTPARYSLPIVERSLNDRLSASGTFAVTRAAGGSGVMFGWFNEDSKGWRTSNSLAFRLDGNSGKYWVFYEYGTRNRRTGGDGAFEGDRYQTTPTRPFAADGTPHHWSLDYEPLVNDGPGLVTFRIDDRVYELPVPAEHRADGGVFNRFGIWNVETGGDQMEVYFDDIVVDGQRLTFDEDPAWLGEGNVAQFEERIIRPHHNYGFSPTQHAGGDAGEIGGILFRDEQPSYFGVDVGRLTLEQPFRASGKVALRSAGADSGVVLGWFNAAAKRNKTTPEYDARQTDYLGVMIEGPSRVGHYFRAAYSSSTGTGGAPLADPLSRRERPVILPDGRSHEWAIEYRPDVGAGRIVVTFDGKDHLLDLTQRDREAGATFDRFGLFNIQAGGHHVELYLDDLQVACGVPE